MRTVLIASAIAFGIASMSSAYAEPTFDTAGPMKQGGLCKVNTTGSDEQYGFLTPCAPEPKMAKKRKRS
jgi:hypothetical protein